ncbi:hypothetical protein MHN79_09750 [Vibrio sp. Of14-4]|nr:hypothetical protein [Vibrio sp. Of14-4]MCG7489773.1 hypothetical protein [Vibrio sp. Of14-4]
MIRLSSTSRITNGELLEWFFQMLSTISNDDNALLADLSEILADQRDPG